MSSLASQTLCGARSAPTSAKSSKATLRSYTVAGDGESPKPYPAEGPAAPHARTDAPAPSSVWESAKTNADAYPSALLTAQIREDESVRVRAR